MSSDSEYDLRLFLNQPSLLVVGIRSEEVGKSDRPGLSKFAGGQGEELGPVQTSLEEFRTMVVLSKQGQLIESSSFPFSYF